jgi:hypothetical protein
MRMANARPIQVDGNVLHQLPPTPVVEDTQAAIQLDEHDTLDDVQRNADDARRVVPPIIIKRTSAGFNAVFKSSSYRSSTTSTAASDESSQLPNLRGESFHVNEFTFTDDEQSSELGDSSLYVHAPTSFAPIGQISTKLIRNERVVIEKLMTQEHADSEHMLAVDTSDTEVEQLWSDIMEECFPTVTGSLCGRGTRAPSRTRQEATAAPVLAPPTAPVLAPSAVPMLNSQPDRMRNVANWCQLVNGVYTYGGDDSINDCTEITVSAATALACCQAIHEHPPVDYCGMKNSRGMKRKITTEQANAWRKASGEHSPVRVRARLSAHTIEHNEIENVRSVRKVADTKSTSLLTAKSQEIKQRAAVVRPLLRKEGRIALRPTKPIQILDTPPPSKPIADVKSRKRKPATALPVAPTEKTLKPLKLSSPKTAIKQASASNEHTRRYMGTMTPTVAAERAVVRVVTSGV